MDRFKNYGQQFTAPATSEQMQSHSHDLGAQKSFDDRLETIVRNIASGNNACGTLMCNGQLNLEFIRAAVRPVLGVYESEANDLRADKMRLSRESEDRRQALEFVYSNAAGQLPKAVEDRLCQVLGYRPAN